jgi:hypothetical protein
MKNASYCLNYETNWISNTSVLFLIILDFGIHQLPSSVRNLSKIHQFFKLVCEIYGTFHSTQPRYTLVRTQDKSTHYHKHYYPSRPLTTHHSCAIAHSNHINSPKAKSVRENPGATAVSNPHSICSTTNSNDPAMCDSLLQLCIWLCWFLIFLTFVSLLYAWQLTL